MAAHPNYYILASCRETSTLAEDQCGSSTCSFLHGLSYGSNPISSSFVHFTFAGFWPQKMMAARSRIKSRACSFLPVMGMRPTIPTLMIADGALSRFEFMIGMEAIGWIQKNTWVLYTQVLLQCCVTTEETVCVTKPCEECDYNFGWYAGGFLLHLWGAMLCLTPKFLASSGVCSILLFK